MLAHDRIPAAQSVLAHFSLSLPDTTAAKTSSVEVRLKTKQAYGPERRLLVDERRRHISFRKAHTVNQCLSILSCLYPDVNRGFVFLQ